MAEAASRSDIAAGGTIPWRRRGTTLEVALVHRRRWQDWSWPKGKLDPGEDWTAAAVRETREETGLDVRLGRPLPSAHYRVGQGSRRRKEVRYWAAEVIGGDGLLEHEIDEVRWLPIPKARRLLTRDRDLAQLQALTSGVVATRTIGVVRHAHAIARKHWPGDDDRNRPLDHAGCGRARALAPILDAYRFTRVVSSPSIRCADTVRPYLLAHEGIDVRWSAELSEEGHSRCAAALPDVVHQALIGAEPTLFCTHGPVLPSLLTDLQARYRTPGKEIKRHLAALHRHNLFKGEVVVLHVTTGPAPRLIALERHLP